MIGFFILPDRGTALESHARLRGLDLRGTTGFIGIGGLHPMVLRGHRAPQSWVAIVLAGVGGMIIALPAAALVFRLKGAIWPSAPG